MMKYPSLFLVKKALLSLLSVSLLATVSLSANALAAPPSTVHMTPAVVVGTPNASVTLAAAPRGRGGRVVNRKTRIIRGPQGRPIARETCVTRRGPLGRARTECTRVRLRR